MERARRRCRQEWRELTDRWRGSGITGVEFARREGVNANTFAWWRSELAREQPKSSLTLVRVQRPQVRQVPKAFEPIEVVLPSGVIVRVPNASDLQRSADLAAKLLEL